MLSFLLLLLRVGVLSKLLIDQRLSLAMGDFIIVDEPELASGGGGVGEEADKFLLTHRLALVTFTSRTSSY